MTRVHVWGASGYAAAEVIRIVDRHPALDVGALESRSHAGAKVGDHFPLLRTTPYRFSGSGAVREQLRGDDIVVVAGAHGEARECVPEFLSAGARVVDLSADYRFDEDAVYGLAEWNADRIAGARLVANPGCYPTATLLALLPLLRVATPRHVVVDAKSGITGAGRNPSVGSLYAEVAGDIRAYGLDGHRHQPEIERILRLHDAPVPLTFTPHVVPMARGMLADVYALFDTEPDAGAISRAYNDAYSSSPFVRVLADERAPSVAAVNGTNDAEIRIDPSPGSGQATTVVRAICAIDNLGKGAAGQAVQNINLMLGLPEETGFDARAIIA
jgi:N-acetyl-gamma-glutamyl-phosphate reductase